MIQFKEKKKRLLDDSITHKNSESTATDLTGIGIGKVRLKFSFRLVRFLYCFTCFSDIFRPYLCRF